MTQSSSQVLRILERLEAHFGEQKPDWPTDPYEFLVWWHCGYPASDSRCRTGWASLSASIGIEPDQILAATSADLAKALKPGGMVPELRAGRLQEIAERVLREHGGKLRLTGPLEQVRKALKKFPNIAEPGADRILLFAGTAPVAAVPSNCPHVLVRIQHGLERENYTVNYQQAQEAIEAEVPNNVAARQRAYLLLKVHGHAICKHSKPKCETCPVNAGCAYYAGHRRGRAVSS